MNCGKCPIAQLSSHLNTKKLEERINVCINLKIIQNLISFDFENYTLPNAVNNERHSTMMEVPFFIRANLKHNGLVK